MKLMVEIPVLSSGDFAGSAMIDPVGPTATSAASDTALSSSSSIRKLKVRV